MATITKKRTRISHGILVYSTNNIQNICAKSLTIIHRYNSLTNKRIKRYVLE